MKEINADVHRKVLALSSLLQIGDVISSGNIKLDPLLELAVEKAASLFETGFGIVYSYKPDADEFSAKASFNTNDEELLNIVIKRSKHSILDDVVHNNTILIMDKSTKSNREAEAFKTTHHIKNLLS